MKDYKVLLFYKYIEVPDPGKFKDEHLAWCFNNNIKGRIFLASEGINGTVSGLNKNIEKYKNNLTSYKIFEDIIFKEDEADEIAFSKMHVKVKGEIVNSNLKNTSLANSGNKLSPGQLLQFYESGKEFIIVDARNWYESKIGRFKNALTPQLKNFRQWPEAVESLKEFRDKTVVTYCTGGIRCEKASAYMIEHGFKDVYQLDGGIINYTKKFPDTFWEGGIFVFDERRVVEPNSKNELKYISRCHFCGKPTSYYINCHNLDCDKIIVSCHKCKVENDYCCSEECRNAPNKRNRYYG
jgi:UPF0176 protein